MFDFIQASFISLIYLIFKVLEDKFITKENKPIKKYMRDIIIVFISVLCSGFLLEQIKPFTENILKSPVVFTSDPDF